MYMAEIMDDTGRLTTSIHFNNWIVEGKFRAKFISGELSQGLIHQFRGAPPDDIGVTLLPIALNQPPTDRTGIPVKSQNGSRIRSP